MGGIDMYRHCTLCPRACGVNRENGERGVCGMNDKITVARAALHHWEEPCISGARGSGTVFFSGCPLGCVYCQNHEIATGHIGREIDNAHLVQIFHRLALTGAHNINLVTATHFAPSVIRAVEQTRKEGLSVPIVWNTSGYESLHTLRMLEGTVDIYLTDLRYMHAKTAAAYSHASDYPEVALRAIEEMVRQTGDVEYDGEGMMLRGTIVRILLLPGAVAEAKLALLRLHRAYGDRIVVSLMQQYTPMPGVSAPLDRRVTEAEYASLVRYASSLGITHAYTQEREAAQESFIPPFDLTGV